MTENELRKKVADTMSAWVGGERGGEQHREILGLYNGRKPLPRGYALNSGDAYCAAAVSAAWIKAGLGDWVPIECSCTELLRLAKAQGIWVEKDSYVPRIGDAVLYDWQDSGLGDNQGAPDHVGLVCEAPSPLGYFTVREGNMSGGRVGTRILNVDGQYIRGFIAPDYAALAKRLTGEKLPPELPAWAVAEYREAKKAGITDGTRPMEPVTRLEAMLMAYRAYRKAAEEVKAGG